MASADCRMINTIKPQLAEAGMSRATMSEIAASSLPFKRRPDISYDRSDDEMSLLVYAGILHQGRNLHNKRLTNDVASKKRMKKVKRLLRHEEQSSSKFRRLEESPTLSASKIMLDEMHKRRELVKDIAGDEASRSQSSSVLFSNTGTSFAFTKSQSGSTDNTFSNKSKTAFRISRLPAFSNESNKSKGMPKHDRETEKKKNEDHVVVGCKNSTDKSSTSSSSSEQSTEGDEYDSSNTSDSPDTSSDPKLDPLLEDIKMCTVESLTKTTDQEPRRATSTLHSSTASTSETQELKTLAVLEPVIFNPNLTLSLPSFGSINELDKLPKTAEQEVGNVETKAQLLQNLTNVESTSSKSTASVSMQSTLSPQTKTLLEDPTTALNSSSTDLVQPESVSGQSVSQCRALENISTFTTPGINVNSAADASATTVLFSDTNHSTYSRLDSESVTSENNQISRRTRDSIGTQRLPLISATDIGQRSWVRGEFSSSSKRTLIDYYGNGSGTETNLFGKFSRSISPPPAIYGRYSPEMVARYGSNSARFDQDFRTYLSCTSSWAPHHSCSVCGYFCRL